MGAKPSELHQLLDANGKPRAYFMDVGSVVCAEKRCEVVPVRLHFDALGQYERYELPAGRSLTKSGHQPFSAADHEKLHQILSDPYSPLKSIAWDQITMPKEASSTATRGADYDAMTGATALSKRSMVVVGAAYTCFTLWHWSHGEAVKAIREMTVAASAPADWLQLLQSEKDSHAIFAIEQLKAQQRFDSVTLAAVEEALRQGGLRLADPALNYLMTASRETGIDSFFRCCEDQALAAQPEKRVRFLEAVREANQPLPRSCCDRLAGWLGGADSYYEVHLLLTLLERDKVISDQVIEGALALLQRSEPLVVRRAYRYLKACPLNPAQQSKLAAFEQENPDP